MVVGSKLTPLVLLFVQRWVVEVFRLFGYAQQRIITMLPCFLMQGFVVWRS